MNLTTPNDMNRAPPETVTKLAKEVSASLRNCEGFEGSVSIGVNPVNHNVASRVCEMFREAGWSDVTYETSGDVRTGESWASFKFKE